MNHTKQTTETTELETSIFDNDGNELETVKFAVDYVIKNGVAYIDSIDAPKGIHPDDLHAALRQEFKHYEI